MPCPVYLLLLLGCTVSLELRANVAHGASQGEEGIDPFDLARQLRAEICATNESRVNEFYKAKRDEEIRNEKFPGVGKPIADQYKLIYSSFPLHGPLRATYWMKSLHV